MYQEEVLEEAIKFGRCASRRRCRNDVSYRRRPCGLKSVARIQLALHLLLAFLLLTNGCGDGAKSIGPTCPYWEVVVKPFLSDWGAAAVLPLEDGGVVAVGTASPAQLPDDPGVWVTRIDPHGSQLWWLTTYEHLAWEGQARTKVNALLPAKPAGYALFGGKGALPWMAVLDPTGDVQWEREIGEHSQGEVLSAARIQNGGYLVGGFSDVETTNRLDGTGAWAAELDEDGTIRWELTLFEDEQYWYGTTYSVGEQGEDERFVVGSVFVVDIDRFVPFVYRLGADGDTVWERVLLDREISRALFGAPMSDGGLVIVGTWCRKHSANDIDCVDYDIFVAGITKDGDVEWTREHDFSDRDEAVAVAAIPDGGFVVAGNTRHQQQYDALLFKCGADGAIRWKEEFGGPASNSRLESLAVAEDNSLVALGYADGSECYDQYGTLWCPLVIRTDPSGDIVCEGSSCRNSCEHLMQCATAADIDDIVFPDGVPGCIQECETENTSESCLSCTSSISCGGYVKAMSKADTKLTDYCPDC